MSGEIGQAWWEADLKDEKLRAKLRELDGLLRQHGAMSEQTLNRGWNQALDNAGRNLQQVGRQMSSTGAAMTRNLTVPIVGLGVATGKMAFDFDKTMNEIVALTSVGSHEIGRFRAEILALAPAVGKGPQELAEAFYFVASAGFEGAEAMEVLRVTAKAAAAGLGDTSTVAKVVGAAINAYGRENLTAQAATDALVAAIGEGSAEAPEFAGALGNVIGSAAQIGAKFSDVTGAIAAMTNVGIGAAESVTALNQVFTTLFKPTAEAADALASYGLSAESLRTMISEEGLMPTLGLLAEKFEGNAEATALVFGNIRALKGVLALTGADLERTSALLDRVRDSAGATADAFASLSESDVFKFEQAMAELQVTAIKLGTDVLPVVVDILTELAGGAREFAKWWGELDDGTKKFIVQMAGVIAIAGPLLSIVGNLTVSIGGLIRVVAFLGGPKSIAFLRAFGAGFTLALGPIGLVIAALGALALAWQNDFMGIQRSTEISNSILAMHFGNLGDKANALADEMGTSFDDIKTRVRARMEETGESVEEALTSIERELRDGGVSEALLKQANDWDTYANTVELEARRAAEGAGGELGELPPELAAILDEAGIVVGEGAAAMGDELVEGISPARQAVIDEMAAMLSGLAGMFDSDESVREAWQGLIDRMDDPYTEAERKADIFGTDMTTGIRDGLASGDPALIGDTTDLVNRLLGEFALMEPGALESGKAVPPGLRAGMDAEMGALIAYIEQNVTGESLAAMELDAVPPGLEAIASYARGMRRNELLATRAAQSVAGQVKSALTFNAYSGGASSLGTWVNGMVGAWGAQQHRIAGIAGHAARIFGRSLPTEGPLKGGVFSGGYSVGESFIIGNVRALEAGLRAIGASVGRVGAVMTGLAPGGGPFLDYAGAAVNAGGGAAMASPFAGSAGNMAGAAVGGTTTINEYHLHFMGPPTIVDTPFKAVEEAQRMGVFEGA